MNKLRKIRELSWLERWILVRAAVLLVVAEAGLRLLPLQSLLKWIPEGEARKPLASSPDPERIAWLVDVAARHSLLRGRLRPTCLRKSLVLCALLRNHGVDARLVIGTNVSRNFGPQENFRAHSWVIAEAKVLLAGERTQYVELAAFGSNVSERQIESRQTA